MLLDINKINFLFLGKQGENLSTTFKIDATSWLNEFPNSTIQILLKRPTEDIPYACSIIEEDGIIEWSITNTDTYIVGLGICEIRLSVGSVIKKSKSIRTQVIASPTFIPEIDPPSALESWYERMLAVQSACEEIFGDISEIEIDINGIYEDIIGIKDLTETYKDSAKASEENAQASAELAAQKASEIEDLTATAHEIGAGESPTVTKTHPTGQPINLDFGIPKANVNYVTFEIDIATGQLIAYVPTNYVGASFSINGKGHLEVSVNG